MSAQAIQTTVPADVAEIIERMAEEQMIPKSAVVRQLIVRRIRDTYKARPNKQEVRYEA